MSSKPVTNTGTEMPRSVTVRMDSSARERCRTADRMPAAAPRTTDSASAAAASRSVYPKASSTCGMTGRRSIHESPRSPRAMRPRNSPYWTQGGWSSANSRRMAATCSGDGLLAASMTVTSPGARYIMPNTMKVTPARSSSIPRSRLRTYPPRPPAGPGSPMAIPPYGFGPSQARVYVCVYHSSGCRTSPLTCARVLVFRKDA